MESKLRGSSPLSIKFNVDERENVGAGREDICTDAGRREPISIIDTFCPSRAAK
jgi:hypothetical protein